MVRGSGGFRKSRDVAIVIIAGQGIPTGWLRTSGRSRGGGGGSMLRSLLSILQNRRIPQSTRPETGMTHLKRMEINRNRVGTSDSGQQRGGTTGCGLMKI